MTQILVTTLIFTSIVQILLAGIGTNRINKCSANVSAPQESIMTFIREASLQELRWVRVSHNVLSEEKIALLNAELPDITFVII